MEPRIRELHALGWTTGQIGRDVQMRGEDVRRLLRDLDLPSNMPHHRGESNPAWKGGVIIDKHGYKLIWKPAHPHASASGRVREHRLVMEQVLARYLLPTEVVDHINGDTGDNRPENLRVFASNAEHLRKTLSGKKHNMSAENRAKLSRLVRLRNESRRSQNKTDGQA
jgi:hypothetical protein